MPIDEAPIQRVTSTARKRAGGSHDRQGKDPVFRSSAFHVAFRVLLIGVGLSVLAVAALPLFKLPSETRVSIVDRANVPILSENKPDRPDDQRRVAAAESVPGLFGESFPPVRPSLPHRRVGKAVDDDGTAHSRPVPPPQMAEAPFPARSSTSPLPPDGADPVPRTLEEVPENHQNVVETPRAFPGVRVQPSAEPVTPPAAQGPDLLEMRREIDRLAESHLQEQRAEIQKAQLVLSEMQNAKQIDLLRDEIRTLRNEQAELRSAASARPVPPPETPPADPTPPPAATPSPTPIPVVAPTPPAIEIQRGEDPSRYTIRLRGASLGAAVNELAVLAGWNVVTGDEFSQTVTATLADVTAEEAVEALLESHGWEIRRDGRRLLIDRPQPLPPPPPVLDTPAPAEPVSGSPAAEGAVSSTSAVEPVPPPEDLQTRVFQLQHLSAEELLPHVEGLLTPGIGVASQADIPLATGGVSGGRGARLVVRDRAANLQQVAHAIAGLDLPPRQVEIDMTIMQVTVPGAAPMRAALAEFLRSQRQPHQPCPRCGRLHPATAPADPACTLSEPEWTLGGAGWEFAQLQGSHAVFAETVKRFAGVEVLTRERIRVLHQQAAEVGLLDLARRSGAADRFPQGDLRLLNAGPSLSIRPHALDAGKIRLSITSREQGSASETAVEPSGTDVVVQQGCSLVIAGLQAVPGYRAGPPMPGRGAGRSELIILLTPRPAEEASARVTE